MNGRKESMAELCGAPTFKRSAGEEELLRILGRNGDIRKIRKYDISRVKKRMYLKDEGMVSSARCSEKSQKNMRFSKIEFMAELDKCSLCEMVRMEALQEQDLGRV